MDPVWTNLLSGFLGAIVGGILAVLGSIKATRDHVSHERSMESERDARLHRAAVLAVLVELTSNDVALEAMLKRGGMVADHGSIDTTSYDSLLVPLYQGLGSNALAPVAKAYSRLHIFRHKPMIVATEHKADVKNGLDALSEYADSIGIKITVPLLGGERGRAWVG